MMADSAEYLALRRAEEAAEGHRQACRLLIEDIRRALPEAERRMAWTPAGAGALQKAEKAVAKVEETLDRADADTLEKHRAVLERVRSMLEKVLAQPQA
ncbi:MAG: hypothetical protein M5U28_40235 [Sandaracinaceae bacterium]|nr:hypothetical protein [Sandaracinaceae bacterium]